jgi:ABC-2 type transport system ATP-binding protein
MINVEGLTKYYGPLPAIRDVSFHIEQGEIIGFLGPNGAGKTTTLRILTCFSPASSGTAKVLGMDVREDSLKIRQNIGYLPEHVPLYPWMRVSEYLSFVARAKGLASDKRSTEIRRVGEAVGLDQVMGQTIRTLSKGFRQRVGLAQALVGDPPILILDEPTIGLDPRQIRDIRDLVRSFSRNRTVMLSSHILPEVSQVCDRVIIINHGAIVAEDSPARLAQRSDRGTQIRLVAVGPQDQVLQLVQSLPGVESAKAEAGARQDVASLVVDAQAGTDVRPTLARAMVEKDWDVLEIRQLDVSLEDVFIDLVTEETDVMHAKTAQTGEEVA